jgi:hypothetical protein
MAETPLTTQYCKDTNKQLIFHPSTVLEAAFIAVQLQRLGFKYWREEFAAKLQDAVAGCIYLDSDKTIMVVKDKKTDGQVCNIAELPGYDEASVRAAGEVLVTRADCLNRTLVFYPRGFGEAFRALGVLAGLGVKPDDEAAGLEIFAARAAVQGLVVRDGLARLTPSLTDLRQAQILTAADLGLYPVTPQPDNNSLLSAFNEMSARLGGLAGRLDDMSQRIEALEHEILPRRIEKSKPGLDHG